MNYWQANNQLVNRKKSLKICTKSTLRFFVQNKSVICATDSAEEILFTLKTSHVRPADLFEKIIDRWMISATKTFCENVESCTVSAQTAEIKFSEHLGKFLLFFMTSPTVFDYKLRTKQLEQHIRKFDPHAQKITDRRTTCSNKKNIVELVVFKVYVNNLNALSYQMINIMN